MHQQQGQRWPASGNGAPPDAMSAAPDCFAQEAPVRDPAIFYLAPEVYIYHPDLDRDDLDRDY